MPVSPRWTSIQDRDANAASRPPEFNGKCDVRMWFIRLECFLIKNVEPSDWFRVAITYVNEMCLRNIPNLEDQLNNPDGYEKFKRALINKYSNAQRDSRAAELKDFTTRIQQSSESIADYAEKVLRLAREIFKGIDDGTVEEFAKKQFVEGLRNDELRMKAREKLFKKQPMSYQEFVELIDSKELAMREFKSSSSESERKNRRRNDTDTDFEPRSASQPRTTYKPYNHAQQQKRQQKPRPPYHDQNSTYPSRPRQDYGAQQQSTFPSRPAQTYEPPNITAAPNNDPHNRMRSPQGRPSYGDRTKATQQINSAPAQYNPAGNICSLSQAQSD